MMFINIILTGVGLVALIKVCATTGLLVTRGPGDSLLGRILDGVTVVILMLVAVGTIAAATYRYGVADITGVNADKVLQYGQIYRTVGAAQLDEETGLCVAFIRQESNNRVQVVRLPQCPDERFVWTAQAEAVAVK